MGLNVPLLAYTSEMSTKPTRKLRGQPSTCTHSITMPPTDNPKFKVAGKVISIC